MKLKNNKRDISKRYLDLRENALKYTNKDMNLKLENDENNAIILNFFLYFRSRL